MRALPILILSMVGCGGDPAPETSPLSRAIRPAGESKLLITKPAEGDKPFSPGEAMECSGHFMVADGHRPLSVPKIAILSMVTLPSGRRTLAQVDQVRADQGEQEPGGKVPFEAKLRCPKRPGKYSLRSTMDVTPDPPRRSESDKIPRQIVITSPVVEFEVEGGAR